MGGFAVDLHLHSCLSPCGDELMTPNNLVKMATLKGLDLIAVTDHNTARQLPAVSIIAKALGIALLPGLELTTREEVHLLAYFKTVETALAFSEAVYPFLPPIQNKPAFFGPQTLLDDDDEPVDEEPRLLISALDLSLTELTERIRAMGGLAIPAHINRGSNGLLNALGFLPPAPVFPVLETCAALPCPPLPPNARLTHSSDAHRLEDIAERTFFLELPECSAEGFFAWAKGDS